MSWGTKLTYFVYVEGHPTEEQILAASKALGDIFSDYNFVGAKLDIVEDEPKEQMGT